MKPQRRSIKYGCHRDPMPRHSKTCIRRFALGSRLRSVTNYGRELLPGDRGRHAEELPALAGLPGGGRDVGGDDIGRVPVQAASGAVIPHRGPRICMRRSLLYVPQRHPGLCAAVMNACLSV